MLTFEWIEAEIMYEDGTRADTSTHRAKIHGDKPVKPTNVISIGPKTT